MKRIILTLFVLALSNYVHAVVLYDGSQNSTPDTQGWLYIADSSQATQTASGSVTVLDTTSSTDIKAGYFSQDPSLLSGYEHPGMTGITLDRNAGYTLSFAMRLNSENHLNPDRAGFSVIVLSNDLMGIELGFWQNEIWAQSGFPHDQQLFRHAEGTVGFDTTGFLINYDLQVLGGTYTLFADNIQVLTGNVRDYSGFIDPLGTHHPYDIPDFMFFGDNTSSAGANIDLAYIELNTNAVPEPSAIVLFGVGVFGLLKKLKRNK